MCSFELSEKSSKPPPLSEGDLDQLVAGLERQKEELGPIAEELIDLLRSRQGPDSKPPGDSAQPA